MMHAQPAKKLAEGSQFVPTRSALFDVHDRANTLQMCRRSWMALRMGQSPPVNAIPRDILIDIAFLFPQMEG